MRSWISAACLYLVIVSGCTESTTINGVTSKNTWRQPNVGSKFFYSFATQEAGSGGRTTAGTYTDSLEAIDTSTFKTTLFFRRRTMRLTFDNEWMQCTGANFIQFTGIGLEDQPFAIPLPGRSYYTSRDTTITTNGLFIANGTYIENDSYLGQSFTYVKDSNYRIWKYRSIHDIFDTIISPHGQLDTIEVDFAPDLGYFTRIREIRYYETTYSDVFEVKARLDSIQISQ
jgi:hypothetical protein